MAEIRKLVFNPDAAEEYFSMLLTSYRDTANDIFRRDNEGRHASEQHYSAEYQKYVGMQIAMREVLEYFGKFDLGGWISVKDDLPEEGKIVMVHQIYSWERQEDGAAITIGRLRPSTEGEAMLWQFQHYRPDFRNWNCIDNDIICPGNEYVTHWKPLPQRPEEERYGTE